MMTTVTNTPFENALLDSCIKLFSAFLTKPTMCVYTIAQRFPTFVTRTPGGVRQKN